MELSTILGSLPTAGMPQAGDQQVIVRGGITMAAQPVSISAGTVVTSPGVVIPLAVNGDTAPPCFVSLQVGVGDTIDVTQSTNGGTSYTAMISGVTANAVYSMNHFSEGVTHVKVTKVSGTGVSKYATGPYVSQPVAFLGRIPRRHVAVGSRSISLSDTTAGILSATSAGATELVLPTFASLGWTRDTVNPTELVLLFQNIGDGPFSVVSAQATPGTNDVTIQWNDLEPSTWVKNGPIVTLVTTGLNKWSAQ